MSCKNCKELKEQYNLLHIAVIAWLDGEEKRCHKKIKHIAEPYFEQFSISKRKQYWEDKIDSIRATKDRFNQMREDICTE